MKHENIYKLTLTALMAALSYVVFTFLQIKVTLPVEMPLPSILAMLFVYWLHCFLVVYMVESAEHWYDDR